MLTDKKYMQVKGAPTASGQEVENSAFNDQLRSWGEYTQTDDQPLTPGSFIDITCDGGERSELQPVGATPVWDTITSQGVFLVGGVYSISLSVTFTTGVNNNSVTLRLVNVNNASDFLDAEITIDRTGQEVTYTANFEIVSTGSVFKMQANPVSAATVKETRIFTERRN